MTTEGASGPPAEPELPITLYGNPVLRRRCTEVTEFDALLSDLVARLFDTLYLTENGVGLSANQIGRTERVFVFDFHNGMVGHVVNPVVTADGAALQDGDEACLSVPGVGLPTSRLEACVVRGVDCRGADVEYEGQGLSARCFQHELDHLNGRFFIDLHPIAVRKRVELEVKGMPWAGHLALDPRSDLYGRESPSTR
jgi:peptide deformylase